MEIVVVVEFGECNWRWCIVNGVGYMDLGLYRIGFWICYGVYVLECYFLFNNDWFLGLNFNGVMYLFI